MYYLKIKKREKSHTPNFGPRRIYSLNSPSQDHGHCQFNYIHAKNLWTQAQ